MICHTLVCSEHTAVPSFELCVAGCGLNADIPVSDLLVICFS